MERWMDDKLTVEKWMDGEIDEYMEKWMDGWMDG
jgi:hypothetical protein